MPLRIWGKYTRSCDRREFTARGALHQQHGLEVPHELVLRDEPTVLRLVEVEILARHVQIAAAGESELAEQTAGACVAHLDRHVRVLLFKGGDCLVCEWLDARATVQVQGNLLAGGGLGGPHEAR